METKPTIQGQDDKDKNIWQDVKTRVPNRDELNALVKDTAAKVSIDKPKAKTKKGPEL
jgi:hypothetical protein